MAYMNSSLKDFPPYITDRLLKRIGAFEWMTKGKITFIQKDLEEETSLNNYRPIMCLPIM